MAPTRPVRVLVPGILSLVCLLTARPVPATAGGPPEASDPGAPVASLRDRVREAEATRIVFDDVPANIPAIDADFSRPRDQQIFLAADEPRTVVDGVAWSRRRRGPGDLPLVWDAGRRRWEIVQEHLEDCSEALLRHAWYFLRAYESLDAPLRTTNSVVGLGAAALVACEVVNRENAAVTPAELESCAAGMAILVQYEPDLIESCFRPDPARRRDLLEKALGTLGLPPAPVGPEPGAFLERPIETAIRGRAFRLTDLIPSDPGRLEALSRKLTLLTAPTLRASIVAALCPFRHGIPVFQAGAAKAWNEELEVLVTLVSGDLVRRTHRGRPTRMLAPPYAPAGPGPAASPRPPAREGEAAPRRLFAPGPVRADPGVLRPLMAIASQIAAPAMPRTTAGPADGFRLLEALKQQPATATVLALAGSDPRVEITTASTDPAGTRSQPTRLVWDGLVRVARPDHLPGLARSERVSIELQDYRPLGEGRALIGVDPSTRVRIEDAGGERTVAAGAVTEGMRIRGHAGLASPGSTLPFALTGSERETWFKVAGVEKVQVPLALAVTCQREDEAPAGPALELVTALDQKVLTRFGSDQARWLAAWSLDPKAATWPTAPPVRILSISRLYEPRDIVELSLVPEDHSHVPNNIAVQLGDEPMSFEVAIEARALTAGLVDPASRVLLEDGTWQPASSLVTNPGRAPRPGTSIVAGFHCRPPDDPWPENPLFGRHPTRLMSLTSFPVDEFWELTLEGGRILRVGPGTRVQVVGNGGEVEETPVDRGRVQAGMRLATGSIRDGIPESVTIVSARPVHDPARPFLMMVALNLAWLRVEGALVSVATIDADPCARGIRGGAGISRVGAQTTGDPDRTAAGLPLSPDRLEIPSEFAAIEPALQGRPLALFETTQEIFVPGTIDRPRPAYLTRFVRVRASIEGAAAEIVCGPGQPLLAQRGTAGGGPTRKYLKADQLLPGDSVMVARASDRSVRPWPVTLVTPLFHPHAPAVEVQVREGSFPSGDDDRAVRVGLAEDVAFAMLTCRRPGSRQPGGRFGEGGRGQGTGDRSRGHQSRDRTRETVRGPLQARPPDELVLDVIEIPEEAREVLGLRGRELIALYTSENGRMPGPGREAGADPVFRFWRRVLGGGPGGGGPGDRAGMPLDEPQPAQAIHQWFVELLNRRQRFLTGGRTASQLAQVLFLETALASWFRQLGLTGTSERLLLDMLELSVYAGCQYHETEKLRGRLGPHLALPVLLRVPEWVAGTGPDADGDVVVSLNQSALSLALEWAQRCEFREQLDRGQGRLSLAGLLAYWAEAAGPGVDPFWESLPRPDPDVRSDPGPTAGSPSLGRAFEAWLADTADRLRATPGPQDPAGPLPETAGDPDERRRLAGPAGPDLDEDAERY